MNLPAAALAFDQPTVPQACQVLRDVRLGEAGSRGEVANPGLASCQFLDQRESARVREAVEKNRPFVR